MKFEDVLRNFQKKNYLRALNDLNKLITIEPYSTEKINLKGVILQFLKKSNEARENWKKASKIDESYADPYFNMGNSYMDDKIYDLAENYFKKAIACQPLNFKFLFQLGSLYMRKNELEKSFIFFSKSKTINKNFAPTYYNLGIILNNLNKKKNSISFFNQAIKLNPNYLDAYFALGITYREIKNFDLAKKNFLKAMELNPDYPYLKGALRYIKNTLCEWDNYEKDIKNIENEIKNKKKVATPWQGLSLFSSPKIQFENTILFARNKNKNSIPIISKREKINLAYFSADFCEHAVSNQLSQILKLHDKNKFNTIGFYLGNKKDTRLSEVKNSFDKFINVFQKSTNEISKLTKSHNIDIAVDLMGFTKGNKYEIFRSRCAPIQVSYLGFPGTTGLSNMDYLIADQNVILDNFRKFYSEKIIYMPNSYMPNSDYINISKKNYSRKDHGLPGNCVVYCCFNKHYKITPKMFDIWIDVLSNVKNSILWLNNAEEQTKENLLQYSRKNGLDPKRVFFTRRSKIYSDYLSKHQLADIFLDTSPYSAHSTGCGSLMAGVPIITLKGQSFTNNVCSSLLRALKMDELITKDFVDYKNKAIELGNNSEKLLKIKKILKNKKIEESLFNSKIYTQNLEKAFKQIYEMKINNQDNKDIRIV